MSKFKNQFILSKCEQYTGTLQCPYIARISLKIYKYGVEGPAVISPIRFFNVGVVVFRIHPQPHSQKHNAKGLVFSHDALAKIPSPHPTADTAHLMQ